MFSRVGDKLDHKTSLSKLKEKIIQFMDFGYNEMKLEFNSRRKFR